MILPRPVLPLFSGLILGLFSLGALAQQASDESPVKDDFFDEIHEDWSKWVLKTADNVDGFFSNSQADENAQNSKRVFSNR